MQNKTIKYFLFISLCAVYILLNFTPFYSSATNELKILSIDLKNKKINFGSDSCRKFDGYNICADLISKDYSFEPQDIDCRVDVYDINRYKIFIINRDFSFNSLKLYEQRVCLRRLATMFFDYDRLIVLGDFGSYLSSTGMRLMIKTHRLKSFFSLNEFIGKFFQRISTYFFAKRMRISNYSYKNGIYSFSMEES